MNLRLYMCGLSTEALKLTNLFIRLFTFITLQLCHSNMFIQIFQILQILFKFFVFMLQALDINSHSLQTGNKAITQLDILTQFTQPISIFLDMRYAITYSKHLIAKFTQLFALLDQQPIKVCFQTCNAFLFNIQAWFMQ